MLDILRNLMRTAEGKRQEALNAYLDGELRGTAREQFEADLAADPALRAEVAQLRAIKEQIGQLPRVRAPRNYTLDPAVYGAPASTPGFNLYPAMRLATVLTAFFLVLTLGLEFIPGQLGGTAENAADTVALSEPAGGEAEVMEEFAVEEVEAPREVSGELAPETARTMSEEDAAEEAAAGAELFGTSVITRTEVITEAPAALALPAPDAEEIEQAAEETMAQEAAPLEGDELPPGTTMAPEQPAADEVAAVPMPPTLTAETVVEPSGDALPTNPLRIAQIVLGVTLLVFLVATLVVRRRHV
jgi:anti-sigma factor RsiW